MKITLHKIIDFLYMNKNILIRIKRPKYKQDEDLLLNLMREDGIRSTKNTKNAKNTFLLGNPKFLLDENAPLRNFLGTL